MGELHLDIYVERMRREYAVECVTGKPRVAFRETIQEAVPFAYTHKKQSGGAGQYGKVVGRIEPMEIDEVTGKDTAFESQVIGGNIPAAYIPAVQKVRTASGLLACWHTLTLARRTGRDSTMPSNAVSSLVTPSRVASSSSRTERLTRSIPPSWLSVSPPRVPSRRRSPRVVPSCSSPS